VSKVALYLSLPIEWKCTYDNDVKCIEFWYHFCYVLPVY